MRVASATIRALARIATLFFCNREVLNETDSWSGGALTVGAWRSGPCRRDGHGNGSQRLRFPRHHADRAGPRAAGQYRLATTGFYLGAWGSNVDFGDDCDEDVEVDLYAGFRGGEDITWDVGIIYYTYTDGSEFNYPEIYASLGYKWLRASSGTRTSFGGVDDDGGLCTIEANASVPMAGRTSGLTAHVGYQRRRLLGLGRRLHRLVGRRDLHARPLQPGPQVHRRQRPRGSVDGTPDDVFSSEARAMFSVSTTFPWSSE